MLPKASAHRHFSFLLVVVLVQVDHMASRRGHVLSISVKYKNERLGPWAFFLVAQRKPC